MPFRRLSCFIFLILLTLYTYGSTLTGRVVSVIDGDTIDMLFQKQTYRIRLDAVDCPEKSQAFGTRAKQATSSMCFGKTVTACVSDIDRYGRSIAKVILPNGQELNAELIRTGMAWHYKQYNSEKCYADLENAARKAKTGLWSDKSPVAPWDFRHGTTNSPTPKPNDGLLVASKNSNKYHRSTCQWAQKISAGNIIRFRTKAEAEKAGYVPCKVCKP